MARLGDLIPFVFVHVHRTGGLGTVVDCLGVAAVEPLILIPRLIATNHQRCGRQRVPGGGAAGEGAVSGRGGSPCITSTRVGFAFSLFRGDEAHVVDVTVRVDFGGLCRVGSP